MRVLYITEESIAFDDALVRGGAIHVRNVVRGLRERGHEVALIDWNTSDTEPFQSSVHPPTRFFAGPAMTYRRAVTVGRQMDAEVVVSKTRKTYLAGLLAARWLGVPHVVHVGSSLDPLTDSVVDRLDTGSFVARLRAPHDAYLVVCGAIGRQLRRRGIDINRIYDIRNAVDTDRFRPDPEVDLIAEDRQRITDIEGPTVGYVGGLVKYKGVFDLAAALGQTETDPTVVVAGSGPARDRLERELGDDGLFLGSVAYERMPAVYAAVDALVLPSHTEGLPRVLLEAGAAERPVVATDVGGVPEVVADGETGLLCPPRNPTELANQIDHLFSDCDLTVMGQTARERIVEEFTWSAQYDRYEQILQTIVDAKR